MVELVDGTDLDVVLVGEDCLVEVVEEVEVGGVIPCNTNTSTS